MKYEDLELNKIVIENKSNPKIIEFEVNGIKKEIKIKQYLPTNDKIDLVQLTLQQSEEDGVYNQTLLDTYFGLYLTVFYSDIEFDTDELQANALSIYDELVESGLQEMVIQAIPEDEYRDLFDHITAQEKVNLDYKKTATYLITELINNLPQQMEQTAEILNTFDPNKFEAVKQFATAANGGRDINTNQPVE